MVHGGHGTQGADNELEHTDPMCGMDVDMNQGYGKMHDGQLYRICSRNCLDKFEAAPERYLEPSAESTGGGA